MNTRSRTALQAMKTPYKNEKEKDKTEMQGIKLVGTKKSPNGCQSRRERKIALQQDVDKLKKKLRHEENVHRALERAFTRPLGALPRLPPYLPPQTLELLAEVAVLEEEVVRLEEQVVNFRQGLYQEAVYISSSKKSLENSGDLYRVPDWEGPAEKPSISNQSSSSLDKEQNGHCFNGLINGKRLMKKRDPSMGFHQDGRGKENQANANSTKNNKRSPHKVTVTKTSTKKPQDKGPVETCLDPRNSLMECKTSDREVPNGTVFGESVGPNKISEDILKCLMTIILKGSAMDTEAFLTISGSHECLEDIGSRDPYGVCALFGRRDVGPYKQLYMIKAGSICPDSLASSSFLMQRLKLFLEKLALVDIRGLSHQQKLAFWINIYNSCMMNAYLEHGIPSSPQMVIALMQKAMINVGGHLLNAMTIEHFILRLPYNSKCLYPRGVKSDEMTMKSLFGLDWPEPLVTFALSCGSWSSPAVRVYTESQVEDELESAKRNYLQAAVGISSANNKLAIPKLLDWYLLDFAKDMEALIDWVCLQLPTDLRKEALGCLERGRETASQFVQVIPYEFSFRYLLTP
ncbi:hypothetical protein QJS10_CPB19g01510 [Acorus calamus]|uniref:Uncharacterized protein n=1 Tax=Acorus calamus TaxID=4465 RepID=A0AAV9CHY6_ACOCL|nr:hypothetical protein QJS10_CPB19g01510 [Acorus calamus]